MPIAILGLLGWRRWQFVDPDRAEPYRKAVVLEVDARIVQPAGLLLVLTLRLYLRSPRRMVGVRHLPQREPNA
jgi:hypothetical protein